MKIFESLLILVFTLDNSAALGILDMLGRRPTRELGDLLTP